MMVCPGCRQYYNEDIKYCEVCGSELAKPRGKQSFIFHQFDKGWKMTIYFVKNPEIPFENKDNPNIINIEVEKWFDSWENAYNASNQILFSAIPEHYVPIWETQTFPGELEV